MKKVFDKCTMVYPGQITLSSSNGIEALNWKR